MRRQVCFAYVLILARRRRFIIRNTYPDYYQEFLLEKARQTKCQRNLNPFETLQIERSLYVRNVIGEIDRQLTADLTPLLHISRSCRVRARRRFTKLHVLGIDLANDDKNCELLERE